MQEFQLIPIARQYMSSVIKRRAPVAISTIHHIKHFYPIHTVLFSVSHQLHYNRKITKKIYMLSH